MNKTVTLKTGDELPTVGFGTWNIRGEQLRLAVQTALKTGYTHVDTAEGYANEETVGNVICDHNVDREELFMTSKVLPKNLDYESVIRSCEHSLDRLGTDYLDLYLIHWPNPAISLRETLKAMETLHDRGAVRNIGVCNFSKYQLSAAHHISDLPIAVNQIEFHPLFRRDDLLEYCRETNTQVEAAAPLARGAVLKNDRLREIAEKYDRTPAAVALRWAIEKGAAVLPKSGNPDHVRQNFEVLEWSLDDADVEKIDSIDQMEPVYDTGIRDWDDDTYGIAK